MVQVYHGMLYNVMQVVHCKKANVPLLYCKDVGIDSPNNVSIYILNLHHILGESMMRCEYCTVHVSDPTGPKTDEA